MKLSIRDVPAIAGPLSPFLDELRRSVFNIGRQAATKEELARTGGFLLEEDGTLVVTPPPGSNLPPPSAPTGVSITVGSGVIFIEWDGITYPGHAYTEIFRAAVDDFTVAEVIGQTEGAIYVDAVGVASAPYYYWLRFVNVNGAPGPINNQAGAHAQTSLTVPRLLDALTAAAEDPSAPYSKIAWRAAMVYVAGEAPGSAPLFSVVTTPVTNGGVTVPVGTYMVAAFIKNGDITNAKIANLAVDDAKVANLSVGKLLAGSIGVGQYIASQTYVSGVSGWRINADGTAELNNVIVRGGVYATSGTIGGIQIAGGYIQSTNYNAEGTGFRIGSNGTIDLPNGSIFAQQLAVGYGGNLLRNSTWVVRNSGGVVPEGWNFYTSMAVGEYGVFRSEVDFVAWIPPGSRGLAMRQNVGNANGARYMVAQGEADGAEAGKRYEASIYSGAHRCRVYVRLVFLNTAGAVLAYGQEEPVAGMAFNNAEKLGGQRRSDYKRIACFGVAPPETAMVRMEAVKEDTFAGQADSYAFLMNPMLAEATVNQTEPSRYAPAGLGTLVTPSGVSTPSLAALTAILGDCYAGSLRGGSFVGYQWPTDGGGGFYLGPAGLLLGNANLGSYFQIEANGNIHTPGFNIIGGVVNMHRANIVNTHNIVQGAVTFGLQASGNNRADIFIGIPDGEVWNIALFASYGSSNAVALGAVGDISAAYRHMTITNGALSDVQPVQQMNFAYLYPQSAALFSTLVLGPGTHQLTANCAYAVYAFNTPVNLMAFIFKR